MSESSKSTGSADRKFLSVALLGPDDQRRNLVADVVSARPGVRLREYASFPPHAAELASTLAQNYEIVLIDVDSDPKFVFELVERLTAFGRTYLMAYSAQSDMKLAVRFMRAGVREFFTLPLDPAEIAGALTRAANRQPVVVTPPRTAGKLFVFLGSKGGCGVTTLAANFALALAQESDQSTLLIDLGEPLGDVAINLGITSDYSVDNALQDPDRLDSAFLDSLITRHSTGLAVLAAPSEFPENPPSPDALDKLVAVTRSSYDYVVVDAGSRVGLIGSALFDQCSAIYLITQVGISELRNANRMITQLFASRGRSLQIVLNRYTQRALLFDDAQITKTLTRPAQWKVPDDYAAARRTRNTATPMVLIDSAIAQTIREMARSAAGLPATKDKKGLFRLLG